MKAKFTGHHHHAYMSVMALPALQEALGHLSAGARERREAGARAGDVVSFSMVRIVKAVDEALRRDRARHLLLVEANRSLTEVLEHPDELRPDDLDAYADVLVQMKRALRDFVRPFSRDGDTLGSSKSIAELLRSDNLAELPDDRLARRQAQRIDEIAASCEAQRVRFLALAEGAVALMDAKVAGNEAFDLALTKAIGRHSVDRYPVINEYLAR